MARCAARDSQHHYIWVFVVSASEHRHLVCVTPCISHMFCTKRHSVNKTDWLRNLSQTGAVWWRVCVCVCVCVCWWSQIEDLIIVISKQTRRKKKIRISGIICLIKQIPLVLPWYTFRAKPACHACRDTTGHNRTQQNTAGHNRTQQNTAGHNITQQNTTGHNRTQQDTTEHNRTQQNTAGHNRTQQKTTEHNRTQQNTAGHNRTQHDTTEHSRTQQNTAGHNRSQQNTTGHNRTQQDTAGHNRAQQNTAEHSRTQQDTTEHNRTQFASPNTCVSITLVILTLR
jgi:hypothetical protein